MDYPALLAALPQAVVTAVAGTPQGLTTTAQVTVGDSRPVASAEFCWIRPSETGPRVVNGFGGGFQWQYRFDVMLVKPSGTDAELEVWARQLRAAWHGLRPVTVTGCSDFALEDVRLDAHRGEGPDAELAFVLVVNGVETP